MKPSAVLLIDFENFYHSRRDYFRDASIAVGQQPELTDDLATLVRLAERMTELPLAVRRAYANFNMIQGAPRDLMSRGIEPVQVFCLTETQNKNAADMRMAMDAMALACSGAPFEHFVLVTGDSDFIPVILELKSRGHAVSVIAVTGSSGALIRRFADKFKRFEDVVAKPAVAPRPVRPAVVTAVSVSATAPTTNPALAAVVPAGPDELPRIAAALKQVLSRVRPVRMNAVHRELSKELGYSFDPAVFGCNSTGAFVRKHAAALGVVVRGSQNEQEVDLLVGPAPSANGSHAPKSPAPRAPAGPTEPHTAAHYRELLAKGRANENIVNAIPWAALTAVCDATVAVLIPPAGGPTQSLELLSKLRAAGAPDEARLIVSALRCALPRPTDAGVYSLPADTTGTQIRARLLNYIGYVLRTRLADNHVEGPIRPEALAEVFEPGPAFEQARQEIEAALAEPAPEPVAAPAPTPTPAPVRLSARVEAVHTPAGYRELLKAGQEGSSEPEHQSINPPPWTSFDRVCADTFAALAPAPDGGAGLNCDQLQDRLCEAGKDVPVPNYRAHVRRALSVFKLANAVLEQDDRVVLHPQVTDANDIRWAVLGFTLWVLALRLRERGVPGPVRPDVFAAAIAAGPLTDELVPQVAQAVEGIERSFAEQSSEEAAASQPADQTPEFTQSAPTEVPPETAAEFPGDHLPVVQPAVPEPEPAGAASATVSVEVTLIDAVTPNDMIAPEPAPVEPAAGWTDPYAFDGTLPDFAPAHAPADSCAAPEPQRAPDETALETSSSGVLDVAALTSAAMEHPTEPVVAVVPREELTAPEPADEHAAGPVPEPEPLPEPLPDPVPVQWEVRVETTVSLEMAPAAVSDEALANGPALDELPRNGTDAPAEPAAEAAPLEPAAPVIDEPAPVACEAPAAIVAAPATSSSSDTPPAPEDDIPLADLVPEDDPFFWHRPPVVVPGFAVSGTGAPAPADSFRDVPTITPTPPESRPPESA